MWIAGPVFLRRLFTILLAGLALLGFLWAAALFLTRPAEPPRAGTIPQRFELVVVPPAGRAIALTERLIDPFTTRDVRGVVVKSLAALAKEGRVDKQGTGLYRAKPDGG